MQIRHTQVQLPASVTNPVVRVSFRHGAFFTSATMTMVAAITIGAANRSRCAAGLCPCPFRRTGLDQEKTFVVPDAVVLLSHPSDHSVSDINRIKRHILTLFLQASPAPLLTTFS